MGIISACAVKPYLLVSFLFTNFKFLLTYRNTIRASVTVYGRRNNSQKGMKQ